jgi:hypothetical protein
MKYFVNCCEKEGIIIYTLIFYSLDIFLPSPSDPAFQSVHLPQQSGEQRCLPAAHTAYNYRQLPYSNTQNRAHYDTVH